MDEILTGVILKQFISKRDVEQIKNVELVAKLQKKKTSKFLRLYLMEDALELYLQLDDSSHADFEVIKTKLSDAFSERPLSSYQVLNGQDSNLIT